MASDARRGRVLLAEGHRVLVHARSRERGKLVAKALGGDVALVIGDLARIDDVRRLADQAREHGPIDRWVHNAGVWVRGSTPRTSADGYGTTFAVNVLAPHLRTHRLSAELQGRLLWLSSGLAGSARSRPAARGPWPGGRSAAGVRREQGVRCWPGPGPGLGVVDCRTTSRRPSTGVGQDQAGQPRRARRRQLVRGHHRLLLHGTGPGLGALLEKPGADAGPRTAAGLRPPGCDLRGLRSNGRCRLRPTTRRIAGCER